MTKIIEETEELGMEIYSLYQQIRRISRGKELTKLTFSVNYEKSNQRLRELVKEYNKRIDQLISTTDLESTPSYAKIKLFTNDHNQEVLTVEFVEIE